jgi:hypothetical protein
MPSVCINLSTFCLLQGELTDKVGAPQMAYFLFRSLRSMTSGLTTTQAEVEESATRGNEHKLHAKRRRAA